MPTEYTVVKVQCSRLRPVNVRRSRQARWWSRFARSVHFLARHRAALFRGQRCEQYFFIFAKSFQRKFFAIWLTLFQSLEYDETAGLCFL